MSEQVPQEDHPIQEQEQEYKDKYLRALAEMENTRKRLTKEKIDSQSFAIQNIAVDLLRPLDQFEHALSHAEQANEEIRHWAVGFAMILQQFKAVLADHGVVPFDSLGAPFDPHRHEAIETAYVEGVAEGTVLVEFQKGYTLSGRTIRAARVRVAARGEQPQQELLEGPTATQGGFSS